MHYTIVTLLIVITDIIVLYVCTDTCRHIDIFCYGWKQYSTAAEDHKKRELYKKEKNRETERSIFLQLFESFMESAPQLLLQMYILATKVSITYSSLHFTSDTFSNSTANNYSTPDIVITTQFISDEGIINYYYIKLAYKLFIYLLQTVLLQIASIVISLASLSWNLTDFQKTSWKDSWFLSIVFFIAIGCRTNLVTILGGDYFRWVVTT